MSPDERDQVIRLRLGPPRMKLEDICDRLGLTMAQVTRVLHAAGLVQGRNAPRDVTRPLWACPRCGGRAMDPTGHPACPPLVGPLVGVSGDMPDPDAAHEMMNAFRRGTPHTPMEDDNAPDDDDAVR